MANDLSSGALPAGDNAAGPKDEDQPKNQTTAAITENNAQRLSQLKGEGSECTICFAPLPSDPVCVLIRQVYGKRRSCRHYFHTGCINLLMRQPAPHFCPNCREPFEKTEALPDVRLNSRAWFKTVDCDDGGGLEKSEVVDALSATLPVDPELLWQSLDGELWDQWDKEHTGRISLDAFEQPASGLLHFVLYSLPSFRREAGNTNISAPVPDILESREGWFRYWDENSRQMLEFLQFLRALARTLRLDGAKEDAGVLRSVLMTVWQEFGLTESNQENLHKPVTLALFCEKPDGFCDALLDALQKEFGKAKFQRIRQRAHLLQQPAAMLKKELRKLPNARTDVIEKDELVAAILDAQEGGSEVCQQTTEPTSPTLASAPPIRSPGSDRSCPDGLKALSLKELKVRLDAYGANYRHCLEREELEDLLIAQGDNGVIALPASPPRPVGQVRSGPTSPAASRSGRPDPVNSASRFPAAPSVAQQGPPRPQTMGASSVDGGRMPVNQPIPTVTEPPDDEDDNARLKRCMRGCVLQ